MITANLHGLTIQELLVSLDWGLKKHHVSGGYETDSGVIVKPQDGFLTLLGLDGAISEMHSRLEEARGKKFHLVRMGRVYRQAWEID